MDVLACMFYVEPGGTGAFRTEIFYLWLHRETKWRERRKDEIWPLKGNSLFSAVICSFYSSSASFLSCLWIWSWANTWCMGLLSSARRFTAALWLLKCLKWLIGKAICLMFLGWDMPYRQVRKHSGFVCGDRFQTLSIFPAAHTSCGLGYGVQSTCSGW